VSKKRSRIAFPDFEDDRVKEAASLLDKNPRIEPLIISPPQPSAETDDCAKILYERQQTKGMTWEEARQLALDPYYFSALSLVQGRFDGVVAGAARTTGDTVRCALRCVGPKPGSHLVFGFFLMEVKNKYYLFADCAVIPEPSPRSLAHIGVEAARAFRFFTEETPRVAFLSFSTKKSAEHALASKVREAAEAAKKLSPDLLADGELQVDAALDREIAQRKGVRNSTVAGLANVLIFPDLNSGNIGYKLVERLGGGRAIGPILWGLAKPMSDLSRGCSTPDIVEVAERVAFMAAPAEVPAC
jgi:phosphate acetyltransferase